MLCDPKSLVPISSLISIQALTLDLSVPLTIGFPLILHHQQRAEPAIISKLVAIHDKNSGNLLKSNPRVIGSQVLCTIQVKLIDRPICVETYETIRELGRITLRSGSETIAVGKVLSIDDTQTTQNA
jgi:elongation factor 1 alpha-like protein